MKEILVGTLAVAVGLGVVACSSKGTKETNLGELLTGLAVSPSHVSLPQGLTVAVRLTLARSSPAGTAAIVVVTGLPNGVSAPPLTISGTTGTLSLSASSSAQVTQDGGVDVTITVSNGNSSVSAILNLSVTAPGFSLRLAPPTLIIPKGSTRAATVHVSRQSFGGVITVTVSGLPSHVTAEPLSISTNLGNLVFRAEATAASGSFPLTVTGLSGSTRASAPLTLSVAEPGAVDGNFGTEGLVVTVLETIDGGTASEPIGVALQADRKIVVLGNRTRSTPGVGSPCNPLCSAVAVARYTENGTLDTTFGGEGDIDGGVPAPAGVGIFLEANGFANQFLASALAISDAGILVTSNNNAGPDTLVRLTSDGALDPSFNEDGGRPGRAPRTINALAVAVADEKILVAGQTRTPPSPATFALAQYNPDGTLDTTFGDGGILSAPWGATVTSPTATGALVSGEKVKVVGRVTLSGAPVVAVVGFDISDGGSIDTSFNDGGLALIQLGLNNSTGQAVFELQGNTIVVANFRPTASTHADIALASFLPDGGLDSNFADGGVARTFFDPDAGTATALTAATSAGKIVVAGSFTRAVGNTLAFLVVRYNSDGSPDTAFGPDGSGIAINDPNPPNSANNSFHAIVFQPFDGKMVAVGTVERSGHNQFAIVRYLP